MEPIDIGESVFVMLALEIDDDNEMSVSLDAHVVRCDQCDDENYDIGLEFTALSGSNEKKLEQFLTLQ